MTLSYEEWKERMAVIVTDEVRKQMKEKHGLDADAEVEKALQKEYQNYLKEKNG
jgi:hypothetical protein